MNLPASFSLLDERLEILVGPLQEALEARALGGKEMGVDLLGGHDIQRQVHQVTAPRLAYGGDHLLFGGNVRHLLEGKRMSQVVPNLAGMSYIELICQIGNNLPRAEFFLSGKQMSVLPNQSFAGPLSALWYSTSSPLPPGPTGPPGTGAAGEAGPTGPAGEGTMGPTGSAGATGPTGSVSQPTSLITTAKTTGVINIGSPPTSVPLDVSFTTVSGGEYDIQIRGTINYSSGSTTPTDAVYFQLTVGGSGTGTWTYGFQPYSPTSNGSYQIRDRLIATTNGTIALGSYNTQLNGSSARYTVTVSQIDVNRVK